MVTGVVLGIVVGIADTVVVRISVEPLTNAGRIGLLKLVLKILANIGHTRSHAGSFGIDVVAEARVLCGVQVRLASSRRRSANLVYGTKENANLQLIRLGARLVVSVLGKRGDVVILDVLGGRAGDGWRRTGDPQSDGGGAGCGNDADCASTPLRTDDRGGPFDDGWMGVQCVDLSVVVPASASSAEHSVDAQETLSIFVPGSLRRQGPHLKGVGRTICPVVANANRFLAAKTVAY